MSPMHSLALDLKILARTPLEVLSHAERPLMRALALHARRIRSARQRRRWQPPMIPMAKSWSAASTTACLSRDGLARMMLQDCLDARANPHRQPKLVFASNGHAIALAAQDEAFRFTFEQADIIHADGQAAVFASRL